MLSKWRITKAYKTIRVNIMFLHIVSTEYIGEYKVQVSFNNGQSGAADLSCVPLKGGVFSQLKEKSIFAKLKVDKELSTIVWPNGADLAPEYIYFQAFKDKPALQQQFKSWGYIT